MVLVHSVAGRRLPCRPLRCGCGCGCGYEWAVDKTQESTTGVRRAQLALAATATATATVAAEADGDGDGDGNGRNTKPEAHIIHMCHAFNFSSRRCRLRQSQADFQACTRSWKKLIIPAGPRWVWKITG